MTDILFLISAGILIFGVVKILGGVGAPSLPSLPSSTEFEGATQEFENREPHNDMDVTNPLYREMTGWWR